MALTVSIGINEREAVQGVKKLGKSLEEVDQDIDDLGKNKSLDKLEGNMKDLAKEADTTGRKIGTGLDDGFKKAGKGADDFKQEAQQTARESAASFDGSAESVGDAFQELAANAFSGFGPAASIAGLAVAAGFGVATDAITKANEAAEEARDSTYEFAYAAAETGEVLDLKARVDDLTGSIDGLKRVQDIATVSGWDQVEVVKALATGEGLPALTKAFQDGASNTQVATTRTIELNGALEGTAEGLRLGAAGADITADALKDLGGQASGAGGQVDSLSGKITNLPNGHVTVTADLSPAEAAIARFYSGIRRNLQIDVTANVAPPSIRRWDP